MYEFWYPMKAHIETTYVLDHLWKPHMVFICLFMHWTSRFRHENKTNWIQEQHFSLINDHNQLATLPVRFPQFINAFGCHRRSLQYAQILHIWWTKTKAMHTIHVLSFFISVDFLSFSGKSVTWYAHSSSFAENVNTHTRSPEFEFFSLVLTLR